MPNQFLSPEGDLENYFITDYWLIDQYVGDTLWVWGQGTSGQLGILIAANRSTPITTFAGGSNWKFIANPNGGRTLSAGIKTDGTLWTWGSNLSGQLGVIGSATRSTPVTTFAGGTNWKQVSISFNHSTAIKDDGTLWVWGVNTFGQFGDNTSGTSSATPIETFAGGSNWKQVSCGYSFTSAIKDDGTLWVWGYNNAGQLGINDGSVLNKLTPVTTFAGGTNWKQVACGRSHVTAIKTDGTLWTWGINGYANLGINAIGNRSTPVTTFAGGTDWKQVVCGNNHTGAIKLDGTLWMWGFNTSAQLGDNTGISKSTPVTTFAGGTNWKQIGGFGGTMSAAIKTDGTLWTWGGNAYGQLGDNTITTKSTPVTTFAGGTNWKQVTCGGANIFAITSGTDPTFFIS